MTIKRHMDHWRSATLADFPHEAAITADIVAAFGDGGFGVNVVKNRYGKTGVAENTHWTTLFECLRQHDDSLLA